MKNLSLTMRICASAQQEQQHAVPQSLAKDPLKIKINIKNQIP